MVYISGGDCVSANVRIQPATYDKLKALARQAGKSMSSLLADAVE
jgi:hypothetical protein